MNHKYNHGMKESNVKLPSDTIIFGEKRIGSYHVHMDFGQGKGNDKEEVAQNMHKTGAGATSGGSNYAFVDGSTRLLKYGGSVTPVNLWAVTDLWRNAPVDLGKGEK
jgi:prepilin-type processing-associated H-X9-DG protein